MCCIVLSTNTCLMAKTNGTKLYSKVWRPTGQNLPISPRWRQHS